MPWNGIGRCERRDEGRSSESFGQERKRRRRRRTPTTATNPPAAIATPAATAEWTPSFLECGAAGAALRTPFQRRQRFRHARAPHRANDRCRQSELFPPQAKAAPEVAALQRPPPPRQPPPLNRRKAFWSAAPRAPLYGRPSIDANGSGTRGHRTEPTTAVVDPSYSRHKRKRRLKSPHSKYRHRPASRHR
jgi:hypothetical protein